MLYICIPTTEDRRDRTDELINSIRKNTTIPHSIVLYENWDGGWVPAVYNMLEGINDYVLLLGSDTIVHEGCVDILWQEFWKYFPEGDGVAHPYNEIHESGELCQHPLAHSDTIRKYLHRGYTHSYSDNEFSERASRDGKLIYVPKAKLDHNHFVNLKAKRDKTYDKIFDNETIEKDRQLFLKRRANNYKD